MKQKTAILRAIAQKYDIKNFRIRGSIITGYWTSPIDGSRYSYPFGDIRDYETVDTGVGSTIVRHRGYHVSTIWGRVYS